MKTQAAPIPTATSAMSHPKNTNESLLPFIPL
jgi:hypothetical protein